MFPRALLSCKQREVYEELLERQDTLVVSTDDAEMIQTLLERVRARLKFLS